MMETLTQEKVKEILKEFKEKVKEVIKDKFVALILYGSYARGDYEFGSDIDVLLVVREKLKEDEEKMLSKISSTLSLKNEIVICWLDIISGEFEKGYAPLLLNVRKEGIRI